MTVPLVSNIARGAIVRRKVDPMHVCCVVSALRRKTGSIAKVYWFALGANEDAIPVDQLELATEMRATSEVLLEDTPRTFAAGFKIAPPMRQAQKVAGFECDSTPPGVPA
jgi:hypothetical protein